ncbi:MAG: hypothetical protein ACREV2_10395, partial [Burkholderiales bacterium]
MFQGVVGHGIAAILDDDGLAVEALNIGKRLGQIAGFLFCGRGGERHSSGPVGTGYCSAKEKGDLIGRRFVNDDLGPPFSSVIAYWMASFLACAA